MRNSHRSITALVAALLTLHVSGQETSPAELAKSASADQSSLVLHLDVRRVPIDVVVLDKQGKQVSGLKKDDFVVREDGKEQHVLSFDSFNGTTFSSLPAKLPSLPPNTFSNAQTQPERGPLNVLYYDMVNTPEENQMQFRRELLKFVDEAPEGTRMALFVNASGLHLVQGFTSDHALLHEAILQKGPGPHVPPVFLMGAQFGRSDAGAALSNLTFIAQYLQGLPGRKNLIWLSSEFPIPVGPTLAAGAHISLAGQAARSMTLGSGGGPEVLDLSDLIQDSLKHAFAAMMKSQVALYPVSLRGVAGAGANGEAADAMYDYSNMEVIASATGGRAYFSSNKESELVEKAVADGESYYTLSYAPTNRTYDGSERLIQVTLAKKGDYKLTYRQLYYAVSDKNEPKPSKTDALQSRFVAAKQEDTLYADIEHGAPILHDVLFTARITPAGFPHMATQEQMISLQTSPDYFLTRRKHSGQPLAPVKLQRYVIDYGVVDPLLRKTASAKGVPPILEFAAAAYNADGRLLNSMLNQGVPSGEAGKKKGVFHAVQEIEVPSEAAHLRLAVRDSVNRRTGTLEIRLPIASEVPSASAKGN